MESKIVDGAASKASPRRFTQEEVRFFLKKDLEATKFVCELLAAFPDIRDELADKLYAQQELVADMNKSK